MVIRDTRNVTFEATFGSEFSGEGNVGSLDGQQPIEIVIEGSTILKFDHMRVTSSNGEGLAGWGAPPPPPCLPASGEEMGFQPPSAPVFCAPAMSSSRLRRLVPKPFWVLSADEEGAEVIGRLRDGSPS